MVQVQFHNAALHHNAAPHGTSASCFRPRSARHSARRWPTSGWQARRARRTGSQPTRGAMGRCFFVPSHAGGFGYILFLHMLRQRLPTILVRGALWFVCVGVRRRPTSTDVRKHVTISDEQSTLTYDPEKPWGDLRDLTHPRMRGRDVWMCVGEANERWFSAPLARV